jgi:hypothetical protein
VPNKISKKATRNPHKSPENHQKSSKSKCVVHTEQESPQEIPEIIKKSAKIIKKQVCRSYRTGLK